MVAAARVRPAAFGFIDANCPESRLSRAPSSRALFHASFLPSPRVFLLFSQCFFFVAPLSLPFGTVCLHRITASRKGLQARETHLGEPGHRYSRFYFIYARGIDAIVFATTRYTESSQNSIPNHYSRGGRGHNLKTIINVRTRIKWSWEAIASRFWYRFMRAHKSLKWLRSH